MQAKLSIWYLAKHMKIGSVVRIMDGRICTVEGFDITKHIPIMPVRVKPLCGRQKQLTVTLSDVTGLMVETETRYPMPKGYQVDVFGVNTSTADYPPTEKVSA